MPVDKREKKKKKREEKQKAKRREADRQFRAEKAEEYEWQARSAYQHKEYQQALNWALKKLKLYPKDEIMRTLALRCASYLNDEENLVTILRQIYREGTLTKGDHLALGRLSISTKDYGLALEVLDSLISDAASEKPRITGRISRAKLKEAEQFVRYCRSMVKAAQTGAVASSTIRSGPHPEPANVPISVETATPQADQSPAAANKRSTTPERLPDLKVTFETNPAPVLRAVKARRNWDRAGLDLTLKAFKLSFRTSYDQLICLPTLRDVRSLWYQEETARKVIRTFRGRAILADEVGLGKTIEAGLIMKEYMMRGLVRSALVLAPSSLVRQWQEELAGKFGIPFVSTNDALFKQDTERFWHEPFVLASLQTAKSKRHFDAVTSRSYDLVIADEAHHLKNRATLNWKLINAIQKSFLLMLTATPVQNSLEELYNLVTLLRPGHLKTRSAFKEEFVTRGNPTDPQNREKLRGLLKEVMVRNTRSVTQLHLPARFALTVRVAPSEAEEAFYRGISDFVTAQSANPATGGTNGGATGRAGGGASSIHRLNLKKLLEAAGSSHAATLRMLERIGGSTGNGIEREVRGLIELGGRVRLSGKMQKVVELLKASSEQKIIFVNYIATLEYIGQVLKELRIPHVVYHGGLTAALKQAAIDSFRSGTRVLLSTGTGGEGHNLQFCHTMLNYDLPWNPMEIEQRIGRIHRIGQEHEVQVYNFCAAGSIEDRILEVLDRKINMFELVVGEIDMILGRLQGEEEFSDLVYEIWVTHPDEAERRKAFDALAAKLKRARSSYEKSKELDEKLFQEDFGV